MHVRSDLNKRVCVSAAAYLYGVAYSAWGRSRLVMPNAQQFLYDVHDCGNDGLSARAADIWCSRSYLTYLSTSDLLPTRHLG
jgi:hypothetical protein